MHKECAYEAEKAEKLRRKITNRLMAGTIVQEIPLYGFNMPQNGRKVAGVRVVKSLRTQVNGMPKVIYCCISISVPR